MSEVGFQVESGLFGGEGQFRLLPAVDGVLVVVVKALGELVKRTVMLLRHGIAHDPPLSARPGSGHNERHMNDDVHRGHALVSEEAPDWAFSLSKVPLKCWMGANGSFVLLGSGSSCRRVEFVWMNITTVKVSTGVEEGAERARTRVRPGRLLTHVPLEE
ncbi:hypothetical protein [Nonomuraea aridisoli]|uniref:Uncharacterized protein n=1 Tax=Nonomuraea aridisoli TaxID=2070368 RepID=A0A2W2DV93_9ACTN|nr:hypothetical protein [Nonomuraea aridisoli]PZG09065.1 hypothetical protein C1J01_38120 [Nonomuraea aridisoli]